MQKEQLNIRKAIPRDASWIAELCHKQFHTAHEGGFIPEDLQYYVDKTFDTEAVNGDILESENHYLAVDIANGVSIGCVKLGPASLDLAQNVPGAIELTRFYLQPAYIGKGVGSLLMQKTFQLAKDLNSFSIWLHVYTNNNKAISFYEKWGFKKVGKQDFPVRNSCPVGWVMKREV